MSKNQHKNIRHINLDRVKLKKNPTPRINTYVNADVQLIRYREKIKLYD